jgi:hypothetical protein
VKWVTYRRMKVTTRASCPATGFTPLKAGVVNLVDLVPRI